VPLLEKLCCDKGLKLHNAPPDLRIYTID
jgi:hypothetical protein